MTPWQLAAPGNEESEQRALFAWSNMAKRYSFAAANDVKCYSDIAYAEATYIQPQTQQGIHPLKLRVPELQWLHAIPNGGKRDPITAAKLKAEGVKKGIPDIFLPVPMLSKPLSGGIRQTVCHGLYIELKRIASKGKPKGRLSKEQIEANEFLTNQGYAVRVCYGWLEAAQQLQSYVEAVYEGRR